MPDEPGVAPGSPLCRPPPGTPQKGARPPPGSDSEQDSGFSDSGSEHLGRCEGPDMEEPPGPDRAHLGPQPPGSSRDPRPLLVLLRPAPAAVPVTEGTRPCHPPVPPGEMSPCPRGSPLRHPAPTTVPVTEGTRPCHPPVPPAELSPCPRGSPLLLTVPVTDGTRPCHPPVPPAELSPCPRGSPRFTGALLAALALRTAALLRHNRRTQGDIATLRRHTRLLARATRDPRVWPRLCHLLGPSGRHREPPGFGEGAAGE